MAIFEVTSFCASASWWTPAQLGLDESDNGEHGGVLSCVLQIRSSVGHRRRFVVQDVALVNTGKQWVLAGECGAIITHLPLCIAVFTAVPVSFVRRSLYCCVQSVMYMLLGRLYCCTVCTARCSDLLYTLMGVDRADSRKVPATHLIQICFAS